MLMLFNTEKEASAFLKKIFDSQRWDYQEQYPTKSGKAIDFYITDPRRGISFGVECKRRLTHRGAGSETSATVLADHLEQASAYSKDLGVPVFIGPVLTNCSPSSMYTGGSDVDSICALNIFGGRMNVGTFCIRSFNFRLLELGIFPDNLEVYMILRGTTFWDCRGFNEKRLNMVSSTGSKKERVAL
jgi:hypothetical protein